MYFFVPTLMILFFISGCTPNLRPASPSPMDVFLPLPLETNTHKPFRCGYLAARQVIRFYRPGIHDNEFKADALANRVSNDTTSILFFLKDNLPEPPVLTNGNPEILFNQLCSSKPVIVFVYTDFFSHRAYLPIAYGIYHCLVITGFNAQQTEIFYYSDGQGPFSIDSQLFQRKWAQTQGLCIIIQDIKG